jgi:glycosyltransferase involved in cell wall biosynthesis
MPVTEDRVVHLAALVESPDHVCCRYRFAAFRPHLAAAGHCLDLIPFPRSLWGRLRIGAGLRKYDAVVIQRRLLPGLLLKRLRKRVTRLLFDLDDAVYLRDSYDPRGLCDPRRLRRFAAINRSADAVVAGNAILANEARRQEAAEVHIIPTCVDPVLYPLAEHRQQPNGIRLVWIGSSSTLKGLHRISPLLNHVGRCCPQVRLKLVCDRFFHLENLPIEACRWSEASEATSLASADIGVAWVPDDDWSRGKCGLKVLQYMAAGLPVIANPVGVQAEMVKHGESGFLATTAEEWADAVRHLAADAELRRRMGQAGRNRVVSQYSVSAGAALWCDLLEKLASRERVA